MTYRSETQLAYRTRQYQRRQWAQIFRIRRDRLGPNDQLLDEARIADVLTRWFARVLGRLGYISGRAAVRAHVSHAGRLGYAFIHDEYVVGAVTNVFDDFQEEHRAVLTDLVDDPRAQIVRVAETSDLDVATLMP